MPAATPPPIPRHRAGRRSRVADLRARVAATGTDPLAGNMTLVPQNDLVAAFLVPSGDDVTYTAQAFPVAGTSGASLTLSSGATLSGVTTSTSFVQVAAAVGQFTAGARDSLALVQVQDDRTINVTLATFDDELDVFTEVMSGVLLPVQGSVTALAAAAGVFSSGALAQLVVAYSTASLGSFLSIWDLSGPTPSQVANIDVSGNHVVMCTGDFDGDGNDEIAIARAEQALFGPGPLVFDIYFVADGGIGYWLMAQPIGVGQSGAQFAIASGCFPAAAGSGITGDQLAVAWISESGLPTVTVFPFVTTGGFTAGATTSWAGATPVNASTAAVAVAAADFDLDGYDEIVLAYNPTQSSFALAVLDLGATGAIALTSSGSQDLEAQARVFGLALAAGPLAVPNDPASFVGTNAAVIAVQTGELLVGFVPVSTTNDLPPSFASGGALASSVTVPATVPPLSVGQVVIALGDFSGNSLVVGPPTATTLEQVNGLVAVMNLPPFAANINNFGTSVLFQTQSQAQTSLSLSVSASWSTSDGLNARLGVPGIAGLNASLTATYGSNFTNVGLTTTLFNTQVSLDAQTDDEILRSVTDYSFWEYPVYQGVPVSGAQPLGYLMVTWPSNPTLGSWNGLNLNAYYDPDHQIGLVGTYPAVQPADIGQELFYASLETAVGTQASVAIMMTTLTNQSAATTSSIAINQSATIAGTLGNFLEGVNLGAALQLHDTYTENAISTHQVGILESTVILVNLGQLQSGDADDAYTVTPMLYWSSTDGHLVLDYVVSWDDGSSWATSLAPANPTFTLPWAIQSAEWQQLTRCIALADQPDGTVNLVATIWNFGTTPIAAGAVQAQFFLGDPSDGATIGGVLDVPAIAARASTTVAQSWTPPSDLSNDNPGHVYCVLSAAAGASFANLPVSGLNVYPVDYFSQVSAAVATRAKAAHDARRRESRRT